ncbi:MAG: hypothetical protein AB7V43_17060 [Acidimicrobiia bacterium]
MTANKPAERIVSCGDLSCEFLVDPIPRPRPLPMHVTISPAQRRVVFCDSQKPNSLSILRRAQAILRKRGVDVEEHIVTKRSAGIPMEDEVLDRLAAEGGLILSGVND